MENKSRKVMYFIGVTTGKSLIMRAFPVWMDILGHGETIIKGIDLLPHSPAEAYREAVSLINEDPQAVGALVTTHKIDIFTACRDMFQYVDPYAERLGEASCISKSGGRLCIHAKDPISSGQAMNDFVPKGFWKDYGGEVLILGAGGAALAISMHLGETYAGEVPLRVTLSNKSTPRLEDAKKKLSGINPKVEYNFAFSPRYEDNDGLVRSLPEYSMIVNATGLGKDMPGSPLTDSCRFPCGSLVWELNYRGQLQFLRQAREQEKSAALTVVDGWNYFVYGWTQVISEVLHIDISDGTLRQLAEAARHV